MRVMVLGGTGFIGRHAALALKARGHTVLIGTRHPGAASRRLPGTLADCELRETRFETLSAPDAWTPLVADVDVIVNSVGILRPRGRETWDRVHHLAPAALARSAAAHGKRFIHISALGLHAEAKSGFLLSKLAGEHAVKVTQADYSIVRPSLLDGDGGYGAAWIRFVARWPVHFFPADALGRIAALDVRELGEVIAILCETRGRADLREVELGGLRARTMAEYLGALRALITDRPAIRIPIPALLARIASHVFDFLHFSPYSYGHLELLRRDNLPRENLLPILLGRAPTPVGRDLPAEIPARPTPFRLPSPL